MTLLELIDTVKTQSGQKQLDFNELTTTDYKNIVERQSAPLISRYLPFEKHIRIQVGSSPFTFTDPDIPEWISRVDPLDVVIPTGGGLLIKALSSMGQSDITKPSLFSKYDKPNLFIESSGSFLVKALFKMSLEPSPTIPGDFDIFQLDEHAVPYLTDLVLAYTLISIGRGRRAVTLEPLPFEFDSPSLVSEGLDLLRETKELLQQKSKFWLSAR